MLDILILGAGPAGVIVAKTLTTLGYHITLIGQARRLPAVEGLSERALAGLRFSQCQHALNSLGPQARRLAHWNGEAFPGNQEWIVERDKFDAALQEDTREAGIAVIQDRITRLKHNGEHWSVELNKHGSKTAAFVIDARGRSAPHDRKKLRRGPSTIALGRIWRLPKHSEPGTRLTSFADGWAWFALGPQGRGILQCLISTENQSLPPRPRLNDFYQQLLTTIPQTQDWLAQAQPEGAVFARYAHPQFAGQVLAPGYARVGDAAFAIDPLSGHGLYQAIGGALALAATVNTLLARPDDTPLAQRFYEERISDDFLRLCRIGRDFYRLEQQWPERAFWRERRNWPDDQPAHAVADSFAPRIEQRPVNQDGFIVAQEVIVTPDQPRGIWQVAGVPLVPLLKQLTQHLGKTLPEISLQQAQQQGGKPENYRIALAWLESRGLT